MKRCAQLAQSRKGLEMISYWAETFFIIILVVAFIVSVSVGSLVFNYIVVTVFGLMAGRYIYFRRSQFPFYLIVAGGLIGYIIGARYGNWKVTLLLFVIGASASWYLHDQKIVK